MFRRSNKVNFGKDNVHHKIKIDILFISIVLLIIIIIIIIIYIYIYIKKQIYIILSIFNIFNGSYICYFTIQKILFFIFPTFCQSIYTHVLVFFNVLFTHNNIWKFFIFCFYIYKTINIYS